MSYTVTLGASSLEITLDPVADNTPVLYPKTLIKEAKIFNRGILNLVLTEDTKGAIGLNVDLTTISNQGTWSSGTLASDKVAMSDINTWLEQGGGGGGGGDASAANQVLQTAAINSLISANSLVTDTYITGTDMADMLANIATWKAGATTRKVIESIPVTSNMGENGIIFRHIA